MTNVLSPTLIENFLRRVEITRSHNTHRSYKSAMNAVADKLQGLPFNEESLLSTIDKWKQEVSINTIKYRLIVLLQYLKYTNQYMEWVEDLTESLATDYTLQDCPTSDELKKILDKIKTYK